MAKIEYKIPIQGVSNTHDRVAVGLRPYAVSNVRVDRGIIEAAHPFAEQIAAPGGTVRGFTFGRFGGTEEYLAVIDDELFVAAPGASSWGSAIATGLDTTKPYHFQQHGDKIFGVNEVDGLRFHTIGGGDWVGAAKHPQPEHDDLMVFIEKFFKSGTDPTHSIKTILNAGTWSFGGEFSGVTPPTINRMNDYEAIFDFNLAYNAGRYREFEVTNTFAAAEDWTWQDFFYFLYTATTGGTTGNRVNLAPDSMRVEFVNNDGTPKTMEPIRGTQVKTTNPLGARQIFYFVGDFARADRDNIIKITWKWTQLDKWFGGNINATDQFTIRFMLGDVWQNNPKGFDVDDKGIVDKRQYAIAVFKASNSSESELSEPFDSDETPSIHPGSYQRVTVKDPTAWTNALTPADTDEIRLFRLRKFDGIYYQVAQATYDLTQTRWEDDDGNSVMDGSDLFIDEHYMEHELAALTEYTGGHNIPPDLTLYAIGAFRGALGIAAGFDIYFSKPDKPLKYEKINDAPDPRDPAVGRSMFLDPHRSEPGNMILGSHICFAGNKARTFAIFGNTPAEFSVPRAIANLGPIGGRGFGIYRDGAAVLDVEGLWHVRFIRVEGIKEGDLDVPELTQDVRTSISNLSLSAAAVVAVHRSDVFVIEGQKWMMLDRKDGYWIEGDWGASASIVAAAPDYAEDLRLISSTGRLLKWNSGSDFGGSAITWSLETGDLIIEERARLIAVWIDATGTPVFNIRSFDGAEGEVSNKNYTLATDDAAVKDLEASLHYGTRFRFKLSGSTADKILSEPVLLFEILGGGRER